MGGTAKLHRIKPVFRLTARVYFLPAPPHRYTALYQKESPFVKDKWGFLRLADRLLLAELLRPQHLLWQRGQTGRDGLDVHAHGLRRRGQHGEIAAVGEAEVQVSAPGQAGFSQPVVCHIALSGGQYLPQQQPGGEISSPGNSAAAISPRWPAEGRGCGPRRWRRRWWPRRSR